MNASTACCPCSVHEIEQYLAALNIDGLVETSPGEWAKLACVRSCS